MQYRTSTGMPKLRRRAAAAPAFSLQTAVRQHSIFSRAWGPLLQVYSVAGAKSLPAWLSEKKARAAKKDPQYSRRVELLQDLGFPAACQRLKLSPDGQYLFATGTHPPRVPPPPPPGARSTSCSPVVQTRLCSAYRPCRCLLHLRPDCCTS